MARSIDTIWATKKQSDSNFDVKCSTIQFHENSHNAQSDR
jgi:transposase